MANRDLTLRVLGDSKGAERALQSTGDHAKKLGGHFGGLAKAAAFAAGGAGIGIVIEGLHGAVSAAMESEAAQSRLQDALGKSGISYKAHGSAIQDAINKTSNLAALDDEDLSDSFSKLVRTSGNVTQSIQGMNIAADIARARHISLEAATKLVEKGMEGNTTAFKKVGLEIDKNASSTDILRAAQEKFGGAAESYGKTAAGAQDRLKVSFENLQETVGQKVLPILALLFEKLNQVIAFIEQHWPQISAVFDQVFRVLSNAWQSVGRPVFEAVVTFARQAIEYVQDHWSEISAKVREVFNTIRSIIDGVTTVVLALWREFGGTIKTVITNNLDAVEGAFRGTFQTIKGIVNLVDDLIHGRWSQIWGDVKQIVSGVMTAVEAVLEGSVKNVAAIGLKIGSALKNGLIAALEGIGGAVSAVIRGAINAVIDAINSIHISIPSVTILGHKIGGGDIGFDIPHLAQGGIVDRPTLALIGESGPEAVVPLNRGRGFGGGDLHLHVGTIIGSSLEAAADDLHALLLRKQQSMSLGFKAS